MTKFCWCCFPSFVFLIVIKLCATISHGCLLVLIFLRGQSAALEKDRQNLRSMLEALQEGIIWMLIYYWCYVLHYASNMKLKVCLHSRFTICKDKRKAIALKAPRKQYITRAKSQFIVILRSLKVEKWMRKLMHRKLFQNTFVNATSIQNSCVSSSNYHHISKLVFRLGGRENNNRKVLGLEGFWKIIHITLLVKTKHFTFHSSHYSNFNLF